MCRSVGDHQPRPFDLPTEGPPPEGPTAPEAGQDGGIQEGFQKEKGRQTGPYSLRDVLCLRGRVKRAIGCAPSVGPNGDSKTKITRQEMGLGDLLLSFLIDRRIPTPGISSKSTYKGPVKDG